MKTCKICNLPKELEEFYEHPKSKDGYSHKCKECSKSQAKDRHHKIMNNPELAEKERKRCREKDRKAKRGYRKPKVHNAYRKQFPEKYKAHMASQQLERKEGYILHHWSYNEDHYKDCISLTLLEHAKAHRFIIYDPERYMFRNLEGVLLDTKERHEKYIKEMIKTKDD